MQGCYSPHDRLFEITDDGGCSCSGLPTSTQHAAPKASGGLPGAFWLVLVQLIAQSLLATLIIVYVIYFIDQRSFNVTERRPHYQLANGTTTQVPLREWYPLQSDITTSISLAFEGLGTCYLAWIATITWNYTFLLLEKNGMGFGTFEKMMSIRIFPRIPLPGFEVDPTGAEDGSGSITAKRWRAVAVALIMLSPIPAILGTWLLTGSVSWRESSRSISGADIVQNIGLGVNGEDTDPWAMWSEDVSFRIRYISRASALATRAWNSVTDNTTDGPTSRRVIPYLQNLPVASSLENVTVPWFNIQSFNWITNASDLSTQQLSLLLPGFTPGVIPSNDSKNNPLQNSHRSTAILPDIPYASLNFSTDWASLQPVKLEDQTAIVAVNIDYNSSCDAGVQTAFGRFPPDIYMNSSYDPWGYSTCFVFANITYSAGAAICYGCKVVFPIVVESPPMAQLILEADVMTQHALYVMADVIGVLVQANVTLPPTWNNIEGYTKEMLVRGYSSAWTAMSELIASYTPYPSTSVTIPIIMSQAFVDRRRAWAWFALQGVLFLSGVAFLIHVCRNDSYPIADPLLQGFMLDVDRSSDEVDQDPMKNWPAGFMGSFVILKRGKQRPTLIVRRLLPEVRPADSLSS